MATGDFDPQPVHLVGKIVRLEPLTLEHGEAMLEAASDDVIWQFFNVAAPQTVSDARNWIQSRLEEQSSGHRLPFAVIRLADEKFAGSTGYASIDRHQATMNTASWYGVEFQRTGINTECKYLLLKHAFEDLGARRVGLTVDVQNLRSRRAVERIGAVQEGLIRNQRIRRDGTQRHTVVYGFIREEWPRAKQRLESMMAKYENPG